MSILSRRYPPYGFIKKRQQHTSSCVELLTPSWPVTLLSSVEILRCPRYSQIFNISSPNIIFVHTSAYKCVKYIRVSQSAKTVVQAGVQPNIAKGCDANLLDDDGNTPLHLAVREDNSECMVQLLDKNNYSTNKAKQMDVNIFNNAGWTALHLAAMSGSLASVSRLIRAGADCNVRGRSNGRTVLHLAVAHAHIVLVNYILEHSNIDVNAQDEGGHTALHLACSLDNARAHEICASLLRYGADPELKYNTTTAFDFAKSNINVQVYNVMRKHLESDASRKQSQNLEIDSKKFQDAMELEVKEEPYDFGDGFLDSKTIDIVTTLLNSSGMWKIIAVELGQSTLISLCQESENPSRTLLHYIELEEKISLNDLHELLLKLGETEAAAAVRNALGYS